MLKRERESQKFQMAHPPQFDWGGESGEEESDDNDDDGLDGDSEYVSSSDEEEEEEDLDLVFDDDNFQDIYIVQEEDEEGEEEEDADGPNPNLDVNNAVDPSFLESGMAKSTRQATLSFKERWISSMRMLRRGGALSPDEMEEMGVAIDGGDDDDDDDDIDDNPDNDPNGLLPEPDLPNEIITAERAILFLRHDLNREIKKKDGYLHTRFVSRKQVCVYLGCVSWDAK